LSSQDTAKRFARSAGAAAFSQFWRVGITFGVRLILRRYIPLEDYGIWDWCFSFYLILGAARDLGLVYHVMRIKTRPYGNLLGVELFWGGGLALAAVLGAPWIARLNKAPAEDLVPAIQLMSLFLLFEGLAAVPRVFFESELSIGRAVVPEMVRNLLFAVVSVALAVAGHGVWSLILAMVISTGYYAAHLWIRAWGQIPLTWEKGQTWNLVKASLPLASIWGIVLMQRRVGHFVIGARFDPDTVALYGHAFETTFLVSEILVPAITRALYPALVAFRDRPRAMFEAYRLATVGVVAVEALAAFFLFVNAEVVIRILGGDEWTGATPYLRVLCFVPLLDPLTRLGGELLKTHHKDRTWIACALITLAGIGVGGWLLTDQIGSLGMAWANFLMFGAILMAWAIHRLAPPSFWILAKDLTIVYLAPVVPMAAVFYATGDNLWLRFGLSIVACSLILLFYANRYGRDFIAFFRGASSATETSPS